MSRQQFSESYLSHYNWHMDGDKTPWIPSSPEGVDAVYDGKITAQCAAGDYDVTHRDNTNVEALAAAKKVIIKFPNGVVSFELRFRFNGIAGDQHILECFMAAGNDYYNHCVTLTLDQGTQQHTAGAAGTGIWFIDTVAPSNESNRWLTDRTEVSDSSNHIGGYTMNIHGYDRLWIVGSTLDTANAGTILSIDWKQL